MHRRDTSLLGIFVSFVISYLIFMGIVTRGFHIYYGSYLLPYGFRLIISKLSLTLFNIFEIISLSGLLGTLVKVAKNAIRVSKNVDMAPFKKAKFYQTKNGEKCESPRWLKIKGLVISVFITVAIFSYKYLIYPHAQGWDSPLYMYYTRLYVIKAQYVLMSPVRILSQLVLIGFAIILRNVEHALIALNCIYAFIFLYATFLITYEITQDEIIAFWSVIFSGLSFCFYRLFLDLYCQYIAWSISLVAILFILKANKMESNKLVLKYSLLAGILLTSLIVIHPWTLLLVTIILLVTFIVQVIVITIGNSNRYYILRILQSYVAIYIPVVVALFFFWEPVFQRIPFNEIGFFVHTKASVFAERENPLILMFSIAGIFKVLISKKFIEKDLGFYYGNALLISWTFVLSFFILFEMFVVPYRLFILLPLGILSAIGFDATIKSIKKFSLRISSSLVFLVKKSKKKITHILIVILLSLSLLVTSYPFSYISDHISRPKDDAMMQLEWIREKFGFENSSITVLINKELPTVTGEGECNECDWAIYEVGWVIYPGSLLEYLQGLPSWRKYIFSRWQQIIPSSDYLKKIILLPNKWYRMSSLEYAISEEVGSGVYNVTVRDLATIEQVLRNVSRFFFENTSFFRVVAGWDNFYWDFENSSDCSFWLRPARANAWFAVEVDLTDYIGFQWGFTYVILKISGDVGGVFNVYIYVFDDYGVIASRNITTILTGNTVIIPVIVSANKAVWRVRLAFQSLVASSNYYHFAIEYLALV